MTQKCDLLHGRVGGRKQKSQNQMMFDFLEISVFYFVSLLEMTDPQFRISPFSTNMAQNDERRQLHMFSHCVLHFQKNDARSGEKFNNFSPLARYARKRRERRRGASFLVFKENCTSSLINGLKPYINVVKTNVRSLVLCACASA